MPVEWLKRLDKAPEPPGALSHAEGAPPALHLRLRPHRSLRPEGFVIFIAITGALILVPLLALLGTMALWGVLPFTALALWAIWAALRRNARDGALVEELRLWPDHIRLDRIDPNGPDKHWEANPYWVRVRLHPEGGPVDNYLTLKGGGREVEFGAFLTPEERKGLEADLDRALRHLR